MVHKWANNYLKCNGHNVELVHIFLSGSGVTDKSHSVSVIHNSITKILLNRCKDFEKHRVLFLGPTGISTVNNIGGTGIYSGLGIKPRTKLLVLNDRSIAALARWQHLFSCGKNDPNFV